MTDIVDLLIGEIQAELCRLMVCANVKIDLGHTETVTAGTTTVYHTIGAVARSEWKAMPCISWVESGGKTAPISVTSDEDTTTFDDTIRLRVLVQAQTKEACRSLWMNLRNASRRTTLGRQVTWGNYTAPLEEKASKLTAVFAIEADADVSLAVPLNPLQLPGFPVPLADYALRAVVSGEVTPPVQVLETLE
jgi:hypothetical protein